MHGGDDERVLVDDASMRQNAVVEINVTVSLANVPALSVHGHRTDHDHVQLQVRVENWKRGKGLIESKDSGKDFPANLRNSLPNSVTADGKTTFLMVSSSASAGGSMRAKIASELRAGATYNSFLALMTSNLMGSWERSKLILILSGGRIFINRLIRSFNHPPSLTGILKLGRLGKELRGLVGVHKVRDPVEDVAIVGRDLLVLDLLPALDPNRALRYLFLFWKNSSGEEGKYSIKRFTIKCFEFC